MKVLDAREAKAVSVRERPSAPTRSRRPGTPPDPTIRPSVRGRFLHLGDEKLYLRGVTYGTFSPNAADEPFPEPETVRVDFALMSEHGVNTLRTYTVPPDWLLDVAAEHGLLVMVGLPWEQHVAFLDEGLDDDIERRVRESVAWSAGHPAVLCYAIGNEVPSPVVRWHGKEATERFLHRLYRAVKEVAPGALVTYVNYPTTEYLELPFLDFVAFNAYLESRTDLEAYLAKLSNLAGDRPLVMAEIGLDSQRNGLDEQAATMSWQIETAFGAGCSGIYAFAWTDEWYRGGHEIEDWDFGLVTRRREPKPALHAVRDAFTAVPFPADTEWPKVSVVVCSYNGAGTIRDTLEALRRLEYPNFETIVVDDGSTDATAAIAGEYDVRLVRTDNRGLSSARTTGLHAATGHIVAYIDDDAYPERHWLHYLAHGYMTSDYVGMGGPNLLPPEDGPIAECVANAPGGPAHVLVSDTEAEHIPGCNMSFLRSALVRVGGFDPRFRVAGDDVDACWRVQDKVGAIGFSPSAVVWHHRRSSLVTYWKQQRGYGKAEALLADKHPERYNAAGHTVWSGRIYGRGLTRALAFLPNRVYQGTWGTAPFQSLYEREPATLASLALMPEWYALVALLAVLVLLGASWPPLLLLLPVLVAAAAMPIAQAIRSAANATFGSIDGSTGRARALGLRALTALLHVIQPAARLAGRLQHGLTPWRGYGSARSFPRRHDLTVWREQWLDPNAWLRTLENDLAAVPTRRGGDFDRWDLAVRGGALGEARVLSMVEEHAEGAQYARFRVTPRANRVAAATVGALAVVGLLAAADGSWFAAGCLLALALPVALVVHRHCAAAVGAARAAIEAMSIAEPGGAHDDATVARDGAVSA